MAFAPRQRERDAWKLFANDIDPSRLLSHRVENLCGNGTPDVVTLNHYGTTSWLENKALTAWPKRASTCPLKNAFEPGQLSWMRQWKHKRGNAFVLLRVEGEDYYLLDPAWTIEAYTRELLLERATATGRKQIIEYLSELRNKVL